MTTQNQAPSIMRMFYTFKRSQILLENKGIRVQRIEAVRITKPNGEFYNMVQVVYRVKNGGKCATFISCKEYLARATEKRREEAEKYVAYQEKHNPSEWHVYSKPNPNKVQESRSSEENDAPKYRTVHTTPEGVYCDCEDFSGQSAYLSQHPYLWTRVIREYQICKHSLCALSHLGHKSLSSYLKAWQPNGRLSNLSVAMNRTSRARSA